MKTLLDIKNELNEHVKSLKGKKVKNFQSFHEMVRERVNPFLQNYGLKYKIWDVSFIAKRYDDINDELFDLKIPNFKDDKRVKYCRAGQIVDIHFEYKFDHEKDDMRLSDYLRVTDIIVIQRSIESKNNQIKDLRNQISTAHEELDMLHSKLTNSIDKCTYDLWMLPTFDLVPFDSLKNGQKFMFPNESRLRYVCQIGKTEIYCPIVGQNTMGHSMAGGEEVYLKNDKPVLLIQ